MSEVTPEQSILRVDLDAGGWEAITAALINDERLEFDTRGFAAWLLARPDGWQIKAAALPHLLKCSSGHVGRDKARRFLRELEQAGYLTRTRRRGADGRWIWDYFFRPTSAAHHRRLTRRWITRRRSNRRRPGRRYNSYSDYVQI